MGNMFEGIGSGEGNLAKCLQLAKRQNIQQNWKNCKHLIIDEISMIDSELFEVSNFLKISKMFSNIFIHNFCYVL